MESNSGYNLCGDCKYFRNRKEKDYGIKNLSTIYLSDGECTNNKITRKDRDFDDANCNLFESKEKK